MTVYVKIADNVSKIVEKILKTGLQCRGIDVSSPAKHLRWSFFSKLIRERRQLGFVTLNGNFAVNLKPTHPSLFNGKGQFIFLKTKSSRSSSIVVYPPKFEFLRN